MDRGGGMQLAGQRIHYAGGVSMRPHADGCRRLSIVVEGHQEEMAGRRSSGLATCGSFVLKDADIIHSDRFGGAGTTVVSVQLPDAVVEALGLRPASLTPWGWVHDGPATLQAIRLAVAMQERDGSTVEECLLELLDGFSTRCHVAAPAPDRLRSIRDRLHDEPGVVPSVRRLADDVGLHPGSLGRAFRRTFGCTITQYRQRLRAAAVARALLDTNRPLVDIALDHGFADASHMTRILRRELGVPPRSLRQRMRPAVEPVGNSSRATWSVVI
jgi:AraC family transcriptional regulator